MSHGENQLTRIMKKSSNFQDFATGYFSYLSELMSKIDKKKLSDLVDAIDSYREKQATMFVIGNGGSAATASHMCNDFALGLNKIGKYSKPFRWVSLTDNVPVMTACGNDLGFDEIFVQQLESQFRPGDALLAISASGNSPNLVKAAEWVRKKNGKVFSFVGFSGGELKKLSDIAIHVETEKGEYGPVEDLHMIFDHLFYGWFSYKQK